MTKDQMLALAERLRKRADQDRQYAENNLVVAGLLAPELAKWETKEPNNIYAVRMAIDHRNSAKKDADFADDLLAAADFLSARATDQETRNGE